MGRAKYLFAGEEKQNVHNINQEVPQMLQT